MPPKKQPDAPVDELDAILDQALDDFQDTEIKAKAADLEKNDDDLAAKKADREAENVEKLGRYLVILILCLSYHAISL